MFRRISTKLVVAVLAAVAVPFLGFAWFVDVQMSQELSLKVVKQTLKGVAENLAGQVDRMIERRHEDVRLWSKNDLVKWCTSDESGEWAAEYTAAIGRNELSESPGLRPAFLKRTQTIHFDNEVREKQVYDLILLVSVDGRLKICNSRDAEGEPLELELVRSLYDRDYSREEWFGRAFAAPPDQVELVDWHLSEYLGPPSELDPHDASSYQIGFASPVYDAATGEEVVGVLYALVNWRHLQGLVGLPSIKDYFRGWVEPDREPSPYAWIWRSDCDTIIAHERPQLYGQRVSGPEVNLPQMVADALAEPDVGLYREYTFGGKVKNAAFKHCRGLDEGGFGWLVGVGMDNEDIFQKKAALHDLLVRVTAVLLLVVLLCTLVITRRTTAPILELQRHTRRVAEGDLDAQIQIQSKDELGELAYAFNQMTRDLREHREQLVKAEKDAAWREMARQIAHDIKNPLTPIKLSLDLLGRARAEGSQDLDSILDRTLDLMHRQVDNLREIAQEFYQFTGGRKPTPEDFELMGLVEEVLQLHAAWAAELRSNA